MFDPLKSPMLSSLCSISGNCGHREVIRTAVVLRITPDSDETRWMKATANAGRS